MSRRGGIEAWLTNGGPRGATEVRDDLRWLLAEREALAARLAAVVQVLTEWGALGDDGDFGDSDFGEAIQENGPWRLSRDLRAALTTGATTNQQQEGRK